MRYRQPCHANVAYPTDLQNGPSHLVRTPESCLHEDVAGHVVLASELPMQPSIGTSSTAIGQRLIRIAIHDTRWHDTTR